MLKFVDLYCGGGFGARGAVKAGASPILAVDGWNIAAETYKSNFPTSTVLTEKVEELNPFELAQIYKPDVLLTSPECTSHSIARGAKKGSETSRETATNIVPWAQAMNSRWLIVENVNRMKRWGRHNELIQSLEDIGYTISDLFLNAADFGAPQARKRMFLICDKEGTSINAEELISLHNKRRKNASFILDREGTHKSKPLYRPGRATATLERAERGIAALGRGTDFLIVYYGSDYAGGWQSLDAPLRTVTTLDRFGLISWRDDIPYLRMLQPNELMKAMGTGKTHALPHGSRRDRVKLCGNGVCSPVMEVIFRKILQVQHLESLSSS
ncbi:MAG: DNA cytosine methyltransferase [Pseudomonadota bacterium]